VIWKRYMLSFETRAFSVAAAMFACLALAGCGANHRVSDSALFTPAPIARIVNDTVAAEAIVVPAQQAQISFPITGQVLQVLVSEGDLVSAGQPLASLDTRELDLQVLQAEAELKATEAAAAKVHAGACGEEIAVAQAAVGIAEARITAAEQAVEVAEGLLNSTRAQAATAETTIEIARGNLVAAEAGAEQAQAVLDRLVAGSAANEILIAEQQVEQARNTLWAIQRQRDILHTVNAGEVAAAEADVTITQLQLESLQAGSDPADIAIASAQLKEAQSAVFEAQTRVTQAESRAAQAAARIAISEDQVTQARSQVESAKAEAQQAQAQLDALRAGNRVEDIAIADAEVTRARAMLDAAHNALADAVLRAPFTGTIGMLLLNEGEEVTSQTPVLILGDLSHWCVQTEDLMEGDISRVALGQSVVVTVDALGSRQFVGNISKIAARAGDRRGDKVYMVTAQLEDTTETGLRWGMSAFLETDTR